MSYHIVYRGFESRSCQAKDYQIFCFFAKHTTLRSWRKYYVTMERHIYMLTVVSVSLHNSGKIYFKKCLYYCLRYRISSCSRL